MRRIVIAGLALLLLWPATRAQEEKKKADDKIVLKTEGKLTADDPPDKLRKHPCKVHTVRLSPGGYIIDMVSKEFDCYLRLEDPAGKHVAENDDAAPNNLNSRIGYKAEREGEYRVIATTFDGKTGAYQLAVRKATADEIAKLDPFHDLIGKPAPELEGVFSLNGETRKLSDLKGKVVLLDFWAVWCGPCIKTFPHLIALDKEHKKEGLEVLGVTTYFEKLGFDKEKGQLTKLNQAQPQEDENSMIKDFAGYHKLGYRLMTVSRQGWQKASKDYRFTGIPAAVVIDRQGVVRMVRIGASPENAEALHAEIKKLLAQK